MNEKFAVPMWPTPWYLRILFFHPWRVRENNNWVYYKDIHDYVDSHSQKPV